jgi:DNA helicase II / ATP-dependent DNA helicase PcrA
MAISCVYCSGTHPTPAQVKQCWAEQQGSAPAEVADAVPSTVVPPTAVAAGVAPADIGTVELRVSPQVLGRHVVVGAGHPTPHGWADAARLVIDAAVLAEPHAALRQLRDAAHRRSALVIELTVAFDEAPSSVIGEPAHVVGARHEFPLDELHHLVWANSIDARDPAHPRWWLVDHACRLGARQGGAADVELADGTPLWLDGGPIRFTEPIDGVAVLHAVAIEHGSLLPPLGNGCAAELAPDQLEAVTHREGAARIIAPAGSGKTRVLTERARHLLRAWQLPPGAVSLVAFNKRAQEEMRGRTADLPGLQVRTLNAIALAVINGTPPFAPQPRQWRTIDEPDVRRIIGDLVSFPKRRNTDPVAPWIDALSLVRLGLVDPAEAEARYDGDVSGLVETYPAYLRALERAGAVDFDGQIHRALHLLLTDARARSAAQRASRLLLVDEFQDLTPAHLLLVRLLSAPGGAVFGVGDDDQTIYGYNGADPAWLIDFAALFPGAGFHPLEVNYRCPADVVDAADRLLRHNRRRVSKTIRAASTTTGLVVSSSDDPVADSVRRVGAAIGEGCQPADIAVLTRVNAVLAPVQVALTTQGVPVNGGVGLEFTERTSVRAALAWLRLATAPSGSRRASRPFSPTDLFEALRRPSRPLHPRIGEWVAEQTDLDGLARLAGRLTSATDAERVEAFAADIGRLQTLVGSGASTSAVLAHLVDEIGLGGSVATLDTSRRGMNRSAQGDDLGAVRQLARLHDDPLGFESWLREHLAVRRTPSGVMLATVHRVKGQEWPHVVVHLADADQYPHRLADDVEEERRVFHVALTRASRHVAVVSGNVPSRFIDELTTEPSESEPVLPSVQPERAPQRTGRSRPAVSDHPLLDRNTVVVAPGMVIVDVGTEWTIESLESDGVITRAGAATRRFAAGARIATLGRQQGALRLPGDGAPAVSALIFDELRRFRERVRGGKPAYTVFDDKTLAAIATAAPTGLEALVQVRGVGPAKLDQYGDDIVGIVEAALEGDQPSTG